MIQTNQVRKKLFQIPNNFYTKENKYAILSTLFGLGYCRYMPGTLASAVTIIVGYLFLYLGNVQFLIFMIITYISLIYACVKLKPAKDYSYIVSDEVIGQLIPMIILKGDFSTPDIILTISIFLLFRLLDIKKVWIVKWFETRFSGAAGIILDDFVAGVLALFIGLLIFIIM